VCRRRTQVCRQTGTRGTARAHPPTSPEHSRLDPGRHKIGFFTFMFAFSTLIMPCHYGGLLTYRFPGIGHSRLDPRTDQIFIFLMHFNVLILSCHHGGLFTYTDVLE